MTYPAPPIPVWAALAWMEGDEGHDGLHRMSHLGSGCQGIVIVRCLSYVHSVEVIINFVSKIFKFII